jgi:hypothetical protein
MSKTLVVGDIHTKIGILDDVDKVIAAQDIARVVLLGDYVDEWDVADWEMQQNFVQLLDWAENVGNVVLLVGNHDIAYWDKSPLVCPSGHDYDSYPEVHKQIEAHKHLFKAAVCQGGWLLTHAGLCADWAHDNDISGDAQTIVDALNAMLQTSTQRERLSAVGQLRGGWDAPGPLWADRRELGADAYAGINQIVGHSPVATCYGVRTDADTKAVFCDTFSLMPSGENIGDASMLVLDSAGQGAAVFDSDDLDNACDVYKVYADDPENLVSLDG